MIAPAEGSLALLTEIFAFLQKVLALLAYLIPNLCIIVATFLFTTSDQKGEQTLKEVWGVVHIKGEQKKESQIFLQ